MIDEQNGGKRLLMVLGVIVLVAIVLAIWFSVRSKPEAMRGIQPPTAADFRAAQEQNRDATLEVPDQFPGAIVYVSRADFPAGGFVVVREATSTPLLGSAFFDSQTRIGNVELATSTADGASYFAQGYTDDGDGQFEEGDDVLIENRDGAALTVPFRATRDLPERKG